MKIGFDLDGTLDRPVVRDLALSLLEGGHEVYIITGVFAEAVGWQDAERKRAKIEKLGIPFIEMNNELTVPPAPQGKAVLYIMNAAPQTFARDYRLADLGLRKGALCELLGITLFIDDSETYCEMIPKMSGGTTVLQIR